MQRAEFSIQAVKGMGDSVREVPAERSVLEAAMFMPLDPVAVAIMVEVQVMAAAAAEQCQPRQYSLEKLLLKHKEEFVLLDAWIPHFK